MANSIGRTMASATSEQLAHAEKKTWRHIQMCTLVLIACWIAGLWVDWRWLLTSLPAVVFMIVLFMVHGEIVAERTRRREADSGQ